MCVKKATGFCSFKINKVDYVCRLQNVFEKGKKLFYSFPTTIKLPQFFLCASPPYVCHKLYRVSIKLLHEVHKGHLKIFRYVSPYLNKGVKGDNFNVFNTNP